MLGLGLGVGVRFRVRVRVRVRVCEVVEPSPILILTKILRDLDVFLLCPPRSSEALSPVDALSGCSIR